MCNFTPRILLCGSWLDAPSKGYTAPKGALYLVAVLLCDLSVKQEWGIASVGDRICCS